jgi:hypothetical protein
MEQNFQTSFIPKKPMIEQQTSSASRPVGFILMIAIFIFTATALASGGAYFYKDLLKKDITQMESDLSKAKNRFEPTMISKLKLLDRRLQASNKVLTKHIAISPIFNALQELTMKTVRYTKFTYDLGVNKVNVKMSGQAVGYRSIALQADLFTKNKNLIDPSFSNLSLDDKGNVLFDLTFSVDPSFVDYKQVIKVAEDNVPSTNTINSTGLIN